MASTVPGAGVSLAHFTKSVRWRLTATVVVVVGLALLGGALLLVHWVEATLEDEIRSRNEAVLGTMADALTQGSIPAELLTSESALERRLTSRGDADPDAVEQTLSSTYFFIDGPAVEVLGVRGLVDNAGRIMLFGRTGLPVRLNGEFIEVTHGVPSVVGPLTLHAVTPLGEVQHSVRTLTGALWLGMPLLTIAAGAMAWVISGRTLAPVASMTRRVRELSATTLDARVPVPPTGDEIAELAVTMNEMLDRLERASLSQRQFVSDASHELRSPVASIRAQLETALRYPDDVDWPEVARVVLAEDERLDHLVGNLLAMAHLDEGRIGRRSELDLEDLVLAQAGRLTGPVLDTSGVSAGRVWANSSEMTSVVRNLVDNAVRHARSKVTVSLRDEGPWVVLRVADDGEGVPPEDRQRIFERFTRLEEARERDGGGAGLGLALSKRIVEHHGGRLHVEDAPGGGAMFVVSLPSAGWTGGGSDPAPSGAERSSDAGDGGDGQVAEEAVEGRTR